MREAISNAIILLGLLATECAPDTHCDLIELALRIEPAIVRQQDDPEPGIREQLYLARHATSPSENTLSSTVSSSSSWHFLSMKGQVC